jgi:Raf kinase inhibitor-like YbhB/YbcL family protein
MRQITVLALMLTFGACTSSNGAIETTTTLPTTTLPTTTSTTTPESTTTTELPPFGVTSLAFEDGEPIPALYTCDGEDLSPELRVVGLPEGTNSIAIIVDDPDAPLGTWDHWVEFDIPASTGTHQISADSSPIGVEGVNSWHLEGYMGPCPPQGEQHTYHFRIYALDGLLNLPMGITSEELRTAMEGRVIDTAELTGTYAR